MFDKKDADKEKTVSLKDAAKEKDSHNSEPEAAPKSKRFIVHNLLNAPLEIGGLTVPSQGSMEISAQIAEDLKRSTGANGKEFRIEQV